MARYQYAKNEDGEIVKAVDLVGIEDKAEYICLGCSCSLELLCKGCTFSHL